MPLFDGLANSFSAYQHHSSFSTYAHRFPTTIIIGHQIASEDDPYIKIAENAVYAVGNGEPLGGTPVDFFPFREFSDIMPLLDRL